MTQGGLPDLRSGDTATIAGINGAVGAAKRLADMGFVRGARVEMLKPGSPCLVRVGETCVGLGEAFQSAIMLSGE